MSDGIDMPGALAKALDGTITPDERAKAKKRMERLLETMVNPPETVVQHLSRIGVPYNIAEFGRVNGQVDYILVVDYTLLQEKEKQQTGSGDQGNSVGDRGVLQSNI